MLEIEFWFLLKHFVEHIIMYKALHYGKALIAVVAAYRTAVQSSFLCRASEVVT